MFQSAYRFCKRIGNTNHISACKCKGLSDESIKPLATSDNSLARSLNYIGVMSRIKVEKRKKMNIFIVYEINLWPYRYDDYSVLGNSMFEAVKFAKNTDIDKYKYSGYGIGFDMPISFSLSDGSGFDKNIIIFGADMSSSVHVDDRKKNVILGKGLTQGLEDNTLTVEKEYCIYFSEQNKRYLFVNGIENYKFEAKDSEKILMVF